MRFSLVIASLFTCSLFLSCTNDKEKENTVVINSPETTVDNTKLLSQIEEAWMILDSAETEKITLIKRLLQEVSYMPQHDPIALSQTQDLLNQLSNQSLTQENIKDGSKIDSFDMLSDSVITEASRLVRNTPDFESYPLCRELISDISEINNNTVLRERIVYSQLAQNYNETLSKEKKGEEIPNFFIEE